MTTKRVSKRLMTVKQVAQQWHVSERTVWQWVRKGAVQSVKLSGRRRIVEDAAVSPHKL